MVTTVGLVWLSIVWYGRQRLCDSRPLINGRGYVINVGRGYVRNNKGRHRAARAAKKANSSSSSSPP